MRQEFKLLFRNSRFLYLWVSQLLSQVTVQMMNFLLLARLFTITGSSIATSLLWVSYALPSIFFGPIGAASVDLVSKRKMLMFTNLLQALIIFGFIFIHQSSIFLLYAVVLVYSFLNQFYVPAESSSLPSVVPKSSLPQANSVFFITQQFALIAGFGFAGLMQGFLGFSGSLIVASILLFIAFVSVSFLPELMPGKKVPQSIDRFIIAFFKTIYEGYEFIKGKKTVLYPLFLLLGIQIILAIIVVNLPVIATELLEISVSYAGILIVIPAGVGAVLGSIIVSKKLKEGLRKKSLIQFGLLIMGVSILATSIIAPFLSILFSSFIIPILLISAGTGFIFANIPTLTYLQEVTPLPLRGRVFGNLWFLITISTIFPVLFSGLLTEFLGVRVLLITIAALILSAYYLIAVKGQEWIQNSHQ